MCAFNDNVELKINPATQYTSPNYPIFAETKNNPALLRGLPKRWHKCAKVLACLGAIGVMALAGRSFLNHGSEFELQSRFHFGGSGTPAVYIVHLTEQDALSIVRSQFEAFGIEFNDTPPNHSVWAWRQTLDLTLFNEQSGISIAQFVNIDDFYPYFHQIRTHRSEIAEVAAKRFEQLLNDITVGVFYNPQKDLTEKIMSRGWVGYFSSDVPPPINKSLNNDEISEVRQYLIDNIIAQVQNFINWLQKQDIL